MKDNNHEGHDGHRVDEILIDVENTEGMKPNVVLINAGTNDAQQNYDEMRGTFDRLKQLIRKVQDMHPETTIILSTVLVTRNQDANPRVDRYNEQIRQYVFTQDDAGNPDGKIVLADMNDGVFLTRTDLLGDGIHPTPLGYRKMAAVWKSGIDIAVGRGWVTPPQDNGIPDDGSDNSNCEKVPGQGDGPHQTQKGYGFDDGPYRHKGTKVDIGGNGNILQFPDEQPWKHILFAQIVNAGGNPDPKGAIDDMVWWRREGGRVKADYYTNRGDGHFDYPYWTITMPFDCPSEDVR